MRDLTPFGVTVRKRLIDKRMTQQDLATALGISRKYINLILHGERTGKKYLDKIRDILDFDKAG